MASTAAEVVPDNSVHPTDSPSFCFVTVVAYLPVFKHPTLTFKDDPRLRANDHMHVRCVSKAFYHAADHFASFADETRSIAIAETKTCDIVVLDEASALSELDLIQFFNIDRSGASFVQMGDYQSLPFFADRR